jgi:hypothetical protein
LIPVLNAIKGSAPFDPDIQAAGMMALKFVGAIPDFGNHKMVQNF